MTSTEKKIFDDLMTLCSVTDRSKFFFTDVKSPFETKFRIFNYNYASYSDWVLDSALECRGIMFEMKDEEPVRIASRPMEKFFNLNETPFTMNLDLSTIDLVMAKADGSLISSYIDNGQLFLKSKGSIHSEQSYFALQVISKLENEVFFARVKELSEQGFTCNMEYVAPDNRVVLPYEKKALILLNVRENSSGEYVAYEELFKDAALRPYLVESYVVPESDNFVEEIQAQEGIEGFVFMLKDGLKFKLKTNWYSSLHRTKDSITKNEELFGSVVNGGSDDLRGIFAGDEYSITKIDAFEKVHLDYLRDSIKFIEDTYASLKGKDRRAFAMEAQILTKDKHQFLFGVLMKYFETGINYDTIISNLNAMFLKHSKTFVPAAYVKEVVKENKE